MKQPSLSLIGGLLGGLAAGALAMYYLDTRSGARRRAVVRDRLVSTSHDLSYKAQSKSKRAIGRLKGMWITHRLDRVSHAQPSSDQQLRDRIRSRLGRVVRYPKAVEVEVERGQVRLHGHVLRREMEDLCREVLRMAGVRELHSELKAHQTHDEISRLYSHAQPPRQEARPAVAAVH
ncbi:hypothetical protein GCM10027034_22830 [Ramlibacter solisilvae]|uniref:BON domain-containing protein n=1 Tax=Ramlibacter tataouinensis TaxID=94132 RepID=UPI0007775AC5|nr:BON domain-containing protein [Ramlibacter tataouinensis]